MPFRRDCDRIGTEPATHESGGVSPRDGVGYLDGQFDRAAHVHRPPRHFGTQGQSLQELEDQIDATAMLTDVEQRGDVRV